MAGTAILAKVEFSDARKLMSAVAQHFKERGIRDSDTPFRSGACWATFQVVPRTGLVTITFRHWNGRLFPVINGGRNISGAPQATFVAVLDNCIEDASDEIISALAEALGTTELEQAYTEP